MAWLPSASQTALSQALSRALSHMRLTYPIPTPHVRFRFHIPFLSLDQQAGKLAVYGFESLTVPPATFLILVVNSVKTRNLQHQGISENQQELLKYPFTPQGLWAISHRVRKGKFHKEWITLNQVLAVCLRY